MGRLRPIGMCAEPPTHLPRRDTFEMFFIWEKARAGIFSHATSQITRPYTTSLNARGHRYAAWSLVVYHTLVKCCLSGGILYTSTSKYIQHRSASTAPVAPYRRRSWFKYRWYDGLERSASGSLVEQPSLTCCTIRGCSTRRSELPSSPEFPHRGPSSKMTPGHRTSFRRTAQTTGSRAAPVSKYHKW